ncbi:hypothetical protein TeGR_g8996, partial [Tetraparma gracilis]
PPPLPPPQPRYATAALVDEEQAITLTCTADAEVQTVTTVSDAAPNEVQYIHVESTYGGAQVDDVQTVECDATGGYFGLTFEGETASIAWDATQAEIQTALESLNAITSSVVVGAPTGGQACLPHDGTNAGSFTVTFGTGSVVGYEGEMPVLVPVSNNLEGQRIVLVAHTTPGDAEIAGSFVLSFRGAQTSAITLSGTAATDATAIQTALRNLDTLSSTAVAVADATPAGYVGLVFSATFGGGSAGVGGNVEAITSPSTSFTGNGAAVSIISDGAASTISGTPFTSVQGSHVTGSFQLTLRGHTTEPIDASASETEMTERLQSLDNVGTVNVVRTAADEQGGYTWSITFLTNPGYFPAHARNVEQMTTTSALTSTAAATTASVSVCGSGCSDGDAPLGGTFKLSFNDGATTKQTGDIDYFASEETVKAALEGLDNVGRVEVNKEINSDNYVWRVTFSGCEYTNSADVCNTGDLATLIVDDSLLTGCDSISLLPSETVPGTVQSAIVGTDTITDLSSGYPYVHQMTSLSVGTDYYVRVSARNSESFG